MDDVRFGWKGGCISFQSITQFLGYEPLVLAFFSLANVGKNLGRHHNSHRRSPTHRAAVSRLAWNFATMRPRKGLLSHSESTPWVPGSYHPLLFLGGGHLCFLWFMGCGWVSVGQLEHLVVFFKSRPLVFRAIATWANFITTSQTKPAGWSPPKMAIMSLIHSSLGISSEFAPKMDGFIFLSCFSVTDFWFRHPIIWGPFQLNPRSPGEKKPWPTPPSWARNSITSWNAPGSRWGKLSWAGGGRTSKGRGFLMLMFLLLLLLFFLQAKTFWLTKSLENGA